MAALTDIDFKTTFNYVPSQKVFAFVDTTDYASQSVNPANAVGVLKVISPSGETIYNNTDFENPDINPSVSTSNTTTIPLPLLGDNSVMQGVYQFTYTVQVTDTTLDEASTFSATKSVTLSYTSPSVDLRMTLDCAAPLLSSTDVTSYTINPGTSITPTITRAHTIYYPGSVNVAPVTGTGKVLTTSVVYVSSAGPLQYSHKVVATLSYDLGSDFYISDEVTGTEYFDALCDSDLCDIYCALRSQWNRYVQYKGTSQESGERIKMDLMVYLANLMKTAIDCGRSNDISNYLSEIKKIGNFDDCSCGDDDGTPTLITGLGSNDVVVVAPGTGISVGTDSSGGVTTYTVSFDSTLLSKLNNSYNSVVAVGAGLSLAITTASDGTKTYKVTNTQLQPNILESIKSITFAAGNLPSIAAESAITYGTELQDVTLEALYDDSVSDWQNNPAIFTVSGMFTGSPSTFTPMVTIINSFTDDYGVNIFTRPLVAEVISYDSNSFKFRINDRTIGQAVSGNVVDAVYSTMKILIKIVS